MRINKVHLAAWFTAAFLLAAPLVFAADNTQEGQGKAVITVVQGQEIPGGIPQQSVQLKVNGKNASVTGLTPLRGPESKVEMVVLIDGGARTSLGTQMNDISKFIQSQRPDEKIAVAYMMNGAASFAGPLTTDHAAVAKQLHLPAGGIAGASASPYFCLSDLAKHWPSTDASARREVVMITDGVDYYDMRYDPEDPYVQAAIQDAVRSHLIVYSIYWTSQGRFDRSMYANNAGQNLLLEVTEATGGASYWEGYGNPVDIGPYFADIDRRLDNQYELDFTAPTGNKPQMASMKLKVSVPAKVDAPQDVFVGGE